MPAGRTPQIFTSKKSRSLRLAVAEPSAIDEIWERFVRGVALV